MALRSGLGLAAAFAATVGCGFFAVRLLRTPAHETEPPRGSTIEPPPATPPAPEIVSGPLPSPPVQDATPTYDRASVVHVCDEARAAATSVQSDVHATLALYAAAEDYVGAAIEDAKKRGDMVRDAEYTEIFKALINESDAYTAKVMTPAFIDGAPWEDLPTDFSKWTQRGNPPGLAFIPPQDAFSILDAPADHLRHFILEMEFQVDGLATVYVHVPPPPRPPSNLTSEAFDLTNRGNGGLNKDAKYVMRVEYVGSRLVILLPDVPVAPWTPNPSWSKRRSGGIAIRIPEGTQFKITRMRIKDLR